MTLKVISLQLSSLLFPSLPLTISQQASQDLTTRTLGDDIDKLNTTLEPLMTRLVFLDMFVNALCNLLVRLALCLGCLDDKSLGDFASASVGDLDNSAVVNKGMAKEMSFELCWSDLMALKIA
jgi:hypothetical protein